MLSKTKITTLNCNRFQQKRTLIEPFVVCGVGCLPFAIALLWSKHQCNKIGSNTNIETKNEQSLKQLMPINPNKHEIYNPKYYTFDINIITKTNNFMFTFTNVFDSKYNYVKLHYNTDKSEEAKNMYNVIQCIIKNNTQKLVNGEYLDNKNFYQGICNDLDKFGMNMVFCDYSVRDKEGKPYYVFDEQKEQLSLPLLNNNKNKFPDTQYNVDINKIMDNKFVYPLKCIFGFEQTDFFETYPTLTQSIIEQSIINSTLHLKEMPKDLHNYGEILLIAIQCGFFNRNVKVRYLMFIDKKVSVISQNFKSNLE